MLIFVKKPKMDKQSESTNQKDKAIKMEIIKPDRSSSKEKWMFESEHKGSTA